MPFFPRKSHTTHHTFVPPSPAVELTPSFPTSSVAPESHTQKASPHRAGHSAGLHPEDTPYLTAGSLTPSTGTPSSPSSVSAQVPLRLPSPVDLSVSDDPPTEVSIGRRHTRSVALSQPTPSIPPSGLLPLSDMPQVYTIGYSQPCARMVIDALVWQEGWLLVDIRRAPTSTWTDWTQRALVQRYGPAYLHLPMPGTCPVQNHQHPVPPVLADAPASLRSLVRQLEGGRCCLLLCACKDYRTCHRAQVATLLDGTGVSVRHLVNQTLPPEQMRMGYLRPSGLAVSILLTPEQMRAAATERLVSLTRTQTVATSMAQTTALTVQVSVTAWPATVLPSHRYRSPSQGGY